jgi:cell division protease FtsH
MKHRKLILSIFLYAFFHSAIIQTETIQMSTSSLSDSEQAQMAEIKDFAEDILVKAFSALQKIENKLTEIALLVKKGSFKLGSSPVKIMEVLTENKMTINSLLQSQATIVALKDPLKHLEVAFVISEFCNAFISYQTQQIHDNFKNPKPFNLNAFLKNLTKKQTRSNFSHLEPASLAKQLHKTGSQLRSLDTTVQNIGLTWYNKAARTLDKYVVTPTSKYNLPTITGYAGGVAILGTYSLWKYGCYIKNNPNIPLFMRTFIKGTLLANDNGPLTRNRVGEVYIIGTDTDESTGNRFAGQIDSLNPQVPDNASRLATIDLIINDFMMQNQPLASLGATFFISSLITTWKQQGGIYDRIIKNRDALWNFLRGGEYTKTFRPGIVELNPTVSFKDMVGLEEVKEAFYPILQYIDNPEQLMRIEATPEKGWLLTGDTRTGKSFSVECLCGEIKLLMEKRGTPDKMKFFNISAALVNEYGIKAILEEVRDHAPAVIFIDEIDLLGLQRVGNNKLLSDFLTSMQSSINADPSKIVIIIAATNNPQNIDKALRQNGRFGKEIRFEYPPRKYLKQFILRELRNMAVDVTQFDLDALADKTNGKSFEDLKAVIRNAMTRSWMNGTSLTQQLLEESIYTELNHIIPFERKELPEHEKKIVATHFAGIALAAMHLDAHQQLDKVTIHARMTDLKEEGVWENYGKKDEKDDQKKIEYGAFIRKQSHDSIDAKSEKTILNEVTILLAGFAAEELILDQCGFTCHRNDRDRAYKMIENLVFGGLNQAALPKNIREELKTKAYNVLQKCHVDAMQLLKNHKDALIAIIDELIAKRILNDKEIKLIIDKAEGRISKPSTPVETTKPEEIQSNVTPEANSISSVETAEEAIIPTEIPSEQDINTITENNNSEDNDDDIFAVDFLPEEIEHTDVASKTIMDRLQDTVSTASSYAKDKVKNLFGMNQEK